MSLLFLSETQPCSILEMDLQFECMGHFIDEGLANAMFTRCTGLVVQQGTAESSTERDGKLIALMKASHMEAGALETVSRCC